LRLLHGASWASFTPDESFLLIAPLSFDASTLEIWGPLLSGGRLVVFPPQPPTDLEFLGQVLRRHAVTSLYLSAGLFAQVVDVKLEVLRGLRQLFVGGDVLSPTHTRRVVETLGLPVVNGYGPTEATVFTCCLRMDGPESVRNDLIPIGPPVSNTRVYVVDAALQPVPVGVPGELLIGGDGLARGYLSRPDLTAERFLPDPFATSPGERVYRTGDLVRWRAEGSVDFLGRIDSQVKVRGFRIELSEVEAALKGWGPGLADAAVLVREDVPGDKRLVGYVVPAVAGVLDVQALREHLRQRLPEYMVPSVFVTLATLPLNPSGKVDRKALPAPDAASTVRHARFVEPTHPMEQRIAPVWARELGADRVGAHDHLFDDLGGTSLSVVRIAARLREELGRDVPVVWLFEHPTVEALAWRLERESQGVSADVAPAPGHRPREAPPQGSSSGAIAIIGMAGRFPGARTVAEFWSNLRGGVESITRFSQEELEHMPGLPEGLELWHHPAFVPAAGILEGVEQFDHAFFNMSLREAQFTDPQQRLFLQTAWTALEDAGIDPERFPGAIALYAGSSGSGYAEAVRQAMPLDAASFLELQGTATHESLATKTSYKLGLTGESTLVYTACSTGLVAVHLACKSLRGGESDVALAGATRLSVPQRTGYVHQEGLIFSPDGHCRAFDAKAKGTLSGNGVGAVVLKRLEDAVRDGDAIYAVIKGSALNNDGLHKSGFTAPSVRGQAAVVTQALANAGVSPEAIGYVEAHGTATPLGDPIEVAALTRAYGLGPEHQGTIALASLKTNIGHLDTAAGLAGLMKAALALHHGEIPPSLHFEQPNPQIDFAAGPFFVNTALRPWPRGPKPRFAAVSSFGIGGTNAHAVLGEAPLRRSGATSRSHQLVLLSARTPEALEAAAHELAAHVASGMDGQSLADLAFTLAVGRKVFEFRTELVVKDAEDLARQLRKPVVALKSAPRSPRVAFVFSGQGAQQVAMGRELAGASPRFRAHLEACLALLEAPLRARVSNLLEPATGGEAEASVDLADTRVALPALFSVQVSLAGLWRELGVAPYAVLGHSFGEYAAACVAGVLSLEDAMRLAVARGERMHHLPPGAMLAVALPQAQVLPLLSGRLEIAAINAPDRCVVSGPVEEVERLEAELHQRKAGAVRMPAPHAFHSADVEPLMPELAAVVASLRRSEPTVRFVSGLTGTVARPGELTDPDYWARQMRQPVRFSDAVGALQEEGCAVMLEVGPGQDLTPLVRSNLTMDGDRVRALPSMRRGGTTTETQSWLQAVGALWKAGVLVDWTAFYAHEQRLRSRLPTYVFQEKAAWVEPRARALPSHFMAPGQRAVQAPVTGESAPVGLAASGPVASEGARPGPSGFTAPGVVGPVSTGFATTDAEGSQAPSIAAGTEAPSSMPTGVAASSSARPLMPGLAAASGVPAPVPPGREDAPRGALEERVAALWRERLGMEFIGRDDNFLEIGGNSLTAAQLLNQLRDTFGVQLPLAALFEAPTVAGIALRLEPLLLQAPQAPVTMELPLVPRPRTETLPLSFVQERVWRLEQHLPGLSAYTIPFVLRLEGVVDADVLERGIQEIVQRHEALRTTYDVVDGRPVQRFHAKMHVPLTRVDLQGPPETREAEALRIAREDAAAPYDLVHGPVMRTTLVRLEPQHHLLVAGIHHIVCDTLSITLFVQELGQLYDAFIQGRPSPLPPLPIQYADFGAWQRQSIAEARLPEQEQWWRQRLAAMPRQLDLPTDRPRPANSPLTSARMDIEFPSALARELSAFARHEGFTGYMTVLAAWQTLLHRYSGQTDLIVGTPIANRTRPELFPLIGYVAHSAAFRTRFVGDPTFRELLAQIRDEVADAQVRPDVPYEYLVEALIPGKDIGKGRMADSVFVYHSGASSATTVELIGMRGSLVEVPDTPVQWGATLADLTLVLFESTGRLHGVLEYATELFDASTAKRLLEHFRVLLSAAVSQPDTRISHLPLATEAERQAWPRPRTVAGFTSVPALLADRRARQTDAVAVSRGDARWSWARLGARADALATRLKSLGVTAGSPVVVSLRSSPEKLAALWGVLEAGGAGVALGPSDLGGLPGYAPEGARVPVLITSRDLVTSVRVEASRVLYVEDIPASEELSVAWEDAANADALAWLLPRGAGQPAWALGHRELAEFFAGLDARLSPTEGGTWLAASESAPDRPDLEALWALSRGLRVVFPPEQVTARLGNLHGGGPRAKAMDLSLIYFANDEDSITGPKYELLMEGAKFADANGFSAVWTPERHFHSFGGLYPQPAVISAAIAAVTKNLHLRSGSVVLPLHDPLLIAEQWSVVDNVSQGRVGLSVATGWHVHDFTFAPANYENRREILLQNLKTLRALWRGEKVTRPAGGGTTVELALRPKPVQKELPVWLTATVNPETFRLAGELGAGVLTGLMSHSLEELKSKVALYRDAWRRNGHPGRGHITCMLHTYLGDDEAEVLRTVRQPLLDYFRSSTDISASLLQAQGYEGDINKLSADDINALLERTFEHHAKTTGLIGTVESGLARLREVREADVDEVAALLDFGIETPVVLEGLRRLATVRERLDAEGAARQEQVLVEGGQGVEGLLALAKQSGAVLMHTSARLARTLTELPGARESLGTVGTLVLEDASAELASALRQTAGVEVLLAGGTGDGALLPRAPDERIPSSLQAWVLDTAGQPVPEGVVGELALSGAGLPGGLWKAEEQERHQWVPHPMEGSAKLFRTGRHARLRTDGRVEPVTLRVPLPVARPRPVAPPAAPSGPPPIPKAPRNPPPPLSFAQQRLWYLQQLEPSSSAYNNASTFRLTGALDIAALQASLNELVARHEVLRTTYALRDDRAVQLVHPARGLPLPLVEATGDTPEAREAEMVRLCQGFITQPFDLEKVVIRAWLVRVEPTVHVLALVLHHAVSDAWCTMVLARELAVLYASFNAGQASPLPPLPIQYADYAVWQRDWLEGAVIEEQVAWWKQRLMGAPTLELPTDRPRPAMQSFAGALYRFQLPAQVADPLLALGRKQGATSFMVMMALFQTLLSRYAGQDDFVVGTPIAGRTRPEVEGLMGCFVNTLAFRTRLEGTPSFTELLGRVRTQALEAYARQDAPFERILDTLGLPRDLSRTPLFQVVLNVLNTPEAKARLPSLELTPVEVSTDTSKFDLGLEIWENRTGITCRFEYATALFDEATVARMAEHLLELARQVTANPEAPLARLPLMGEAERKQVLVDWNATGGDYPREACIQDLFMAQAARTPDAVALEFGDTRLTYAQLDMRSNQWAHVLREHGVGPDVLVAVGLDRSVELIVSLLAILKAGGAYVPLDATYPAPRLTAMLEDAPPKLLLTTREVRAKLAVDDALPCLFVEEMRLEPQPTSPVHAGTHSRHLAYVDFTSGSTGRPKGVATEHRGVLRMLHHAAYVEQGPKAVFLLIAPISFDASTFEIWAPLLFGSRLVVFPPSSPSDLELLARTIHRHRVTTLFLTSGLFSQVVDLKPEALWGVRNLLTGGDVISAPHVRRVVEMGVHVTACYGPTETTVFASTLRMTDASQVATSIPLGRPIAETGFYVLDANGQPVPPGVPGEMFIGGDGLARGYISRPELTAERFVPHPFSSTPGERLYRTGDLGRWTPDGVLEFLGRTDDQVKVRGFRIELGEVEAALLAHPDVREAVAMVREEVPGDKRLTAWFVSERALDPGTLREFLTQRLPEYMLPSALVPRDALPLTPNGKLDRKALRAQAIAQPIASAYEAPVTPTEVALAAIWAELLRVPSVGRNDNFFELGGHSLLAMQVVARLRTHFGVELPLRAFFERATVSVLAARIDSLRGTAGTAPAPVSLATVKRPDVLPLSFAQQRLWFIDQLAPGSSLYNIPIGLTFSGTLDVDALRSSLDALMARHEALRTTFREEAGQPVQVIHAKLQVPFETMDLSDIPAVESRQAEALRLRREEALRPFSLSDGPLMRALLLKLGTQEHQLVLNTHHIVSDGWSLGVLVREFNAFYEAFHHGRPPALPALPVQYADFAVWQRDWLQGDTLDAQLTWWKAALAGASGVLELPTDKPRPSVLSSEGATVPVRIPRALSEQVEAFAKQENVTPYMVWLAALQTLLHRYSGQDDVLVGSPVANRRHAETEGLIGFFVNTLVLRSRFGDVSTFRELLAQVRATMMGAQEHQDVPFEKLVEALQPARDLGRTPFFQVLFALQNAPLPELSLPGLTLRPLEPDSGGARFDLELSLFRNPEGFEGVLLYRTALFEPATAARMVRHLERLVGAVISAPTLPLVRLPLLTQDEREQLLVRWNDTRVEFPRGERIHDLFEQQVARTPDAIAVVFEGQRLTYAQLDAKANQLAHHLGSLDVGPESLVGVCLERSLEMVVALLGVLKAGAAYVPLDPAYPRDRLQWMLEDTQAPVLLVQEHLVAKLPLEGSETQVVCVDTGWERIARHPTTPPAPRGTADALAYVIFTSGSTGRPKGAMNAHAGVVNRLRWMQQEDGLTSEDAVLQKTPFSFDVSVWEFFWPLMSGARLVMARPGGHQEPAYLVRLLAEQRITTAHFVPSMLRVFVEEPGLEGLTHLRRVMCSGEALPADLVRRAHARLPVAEVFNLYGPTEAAVEVTYWHCPRSEDLRRVLIGRPVANTRLHVLDRHGEPVPVGVAGELFLAGVQVGRGYWRRPELTAEKFLPDPFSLTPGARMYRTGDLARWLSDGTVEYLGRADFQVKVRGFRIELGEVETVLRQVPGVQEAVVLAREDVPGDKRLVGYLVPSGDALELDAVKASIAKQLPEYMVPSAWVLLPSLPLNPNGKVERKALPRPEAGAERKHVYVAPRNPTEQVLASLWESVLGVKHVGVQDSFFELGGHSLLATQAVSRIRTEFDIDLPLRALFEAPTVAALAQQVESARRSGQRMTLPALVKQERTGEAPLSFAQQRLWFLDQLQPGSDFYNLPAAVRLSGPLDVEALRRTFNELVRRHESLRTSFPVRDGQPAQAIAPATQAVLESEDFAALPAAEREAEAQRRAQQESQRPFDLAQGPLFRAKLLRLSATEHVLVLVMHHIVSDGWSMGVLVKELGALYGAFTQGHASPLPELPVQYADYAAWQRGWLKDEVLEAQLSWWRQQLEGAPPALELPTDKPRPAVQRFRGASYSVTLPRALEAQVKALAQREGVTSFMLLLTAWQVVLARYSGQQDISVGTPIVRCVRRHWARTRTRRCPSRSWWRS
ncbi:MAG: amino acid adenylation domain-containing protein, partial [Myxococcaceae bacterium]